MRHAWQGAFVAALELVAISVGLVWASGSLIRFSGAVVTPTCAAVSPGRAGSDGGAPDARASCGITQAGRPGELANPAIYRRQIIRLGAGEPIPALARFSDEVAAASSGGERPLLLVQTYE